MSEHDEGCADGCCGGRHHDEGQGCCGRHGCGGTGERDRIVLFVVGPLETNCYAYVSRGECLIVDPGNSGAKVAAHLPEGVTVRYLAATHGHGDHVGGVKALRDAVGGRYVIHPADAELARHAGEPSETGRAYDDNAPEPDFTYEEGDVLQLGSARFRVMETPGHTPGSVCLVGEGTATGVAFMGDTLFQGSCGRTDLTGGSPRDMSLSLARLRRELDPQTRLLCGHGEMTTMEEELASNPYLRS